MSNLDAYIGPINGKNRLATRISVMDEVALMTTLTRRTVTALFSHNRLFLHQDRSRNMDQNHQIIGLRGFESSRPSNVMGRKFGTFI